MPVPEEGHLLLKRPGGVDHLVQPPDLQPDLFRGHPVGHYWLRVVVHEPADGAVESKLRVLVQLLLARPESGSSQQVRHAGAFIVESHRSPRSAAPRALAPPGPAFASRARRPAGPSPAAP